MKVEKTIEERLETLESKVLSLTKMNKALKELVRFYESGVFGTIEWHGMEIIKLNNSILQMSQSSTNLQCSDETSYPEWVENVHKLSNELSGVIKPGYIVCSGVDGALDTIIHITNKDITTGFVENTDNLGTPYCLCSRGARKLSRFADRWVNSDFIYISKSGCIETTLKEAIDRFSSRMWFPDVSEILKAYSDDGLAVKAATI